MSGRLPTEMLMLSGESWLLLLPPPLLLLLPLPLPLPERLPLPLPLPVLLFWPLTQILPWSHPFPDPSLGRCSCPRPSSCP